MLPVAPRYAALEPKPAAPWHLTQSWSTRPAIAVAQPAVDSKAGSLFETIQGQDARLFAAYNSCDLKILGGMVSEDLEFYHDQTGPFPRPPGLCRRHQDQYLRQDPPRTGPRDDGGLPVKGYGAVEIGDHVFCPAATPSACNPKKRHGQVHHAVAADGHRLEADLRDQL